MTQTGSYHKHASHGGYSMSKETGIEAFLGFRLICNTEWLAMRQIGASSVSPCLDTMCCYELGLQVVKEIRTVHLLFQGSFLLSKPFFQTLSQMDLGIVQPEVTSCGSRHKTNFQTSGVATHPVRVVLQDPTSCSIQLFVPRSSSGLLVLPASTLETLITAKKRKKKRGRCKYTIQTNKMSRIHGLFIFCWMNCLFLR